MELGQEEKIVLVLQFTPSGVLIGGNQNVSTERLVELLEFLLKIIRDGVGERVKFGSAPMEGPVPVPPH